MLLSWQHNLIQMLLTLSRLIQASAAHFDNSYSSACNFQSSLSDLSKLLIFYFGNPVLD